jgi:arsenate reductase
VKPAILVLCTGNSARSQMAEGLFRHSLGDRFEVHSAGTRPSQVRPEAIAVMAELGIDISGHWSKSADQFLGREFAYIFTVCDNAKESCPVFHCPAERIHWSFEDPAAVEGDEETRLGSFRRIRDQIKELVSHFASAA